MTIREFAKVDQSEKVYLLKNMATFLDSYIDGGQLIYIYSLSGFFVEATINPATEAIIDIIPYRRGFLMNRNYLTNHLRRDFLSYIRVA